MTTIRRIPDTETAAMLRAALKGEFPDTKFSVRVTRGRSIRVRWADGPVEADVRRVTDFYAGEDFDAMADMGVPRRSLIVHDDGREEAVQFGVRFVFTNRDHSDPFRAWAKSEIERVTSAVFDYGTPAPVVNAEGDKVEIIGGRVWTMRDAARGRSAYELIEALCAATDARL